MSRVAIVGSGSFGCVLANLISNNGHDVKIWAFDPAERDIINNEHRCKYIENGYINKIYLLHLILILLYMILNLLF